MQVTLGGFTLTHHAEEYPWGYPIELGMPYDLCEVPSILHSLGDPPMQTVTQNPTLKLGSQGAKVREMQSLLNQRTSRDYMVTVDGVFGAKTEEAVKVFQYSRLLKSDGIVGPKTWQSLRTGEPAQYPTIQRGSSGEAVTIVQSLLKGPGLYKGAVDGQFGPQMETAIKTFQQGRGLTVDGIIGKRTWDALYGFAFYLAFD